MSVMTTDEYDVVIVGGGINGVGVAQASAAHGYRTLLLEKNSQAGQETSSQSSKLIHGGLRYLETMEIKLVRESLRERELLLKLAPQLVQLQTFNIPLYGNSRRSVFSLHAGLSLYALLAGLKPHARYRLLDKNRWGETEGLQTQGLKKVFQYQDAQTDDAALTRAVLHSATSLGAEYQGRSEVLKIDHSGKRVATEYVVNGEEKIVESAVIINATGPWVSSLNERLFPAIPRRDLDLVQGAHLVFDFPLKQAYYLEAPQDGRAVFLLPWKGKTLLGTTENRYTGNPAQVRVLDSERKYLVDVYDHYFPAHDKTIVDEMVGCRVLPAAEGSLFRRSRETEFHCERTENPRVVSIVGGKLTVFRKTAEEVMNIIQPCLPQRKQIANTETLKLSPVNEM